MRKGKQPTDAVKSIEPEYYVRHKYQPFTIDLTSRKL